jgi:hypothetical protein
VDTAEQDRFQQGYVIPGSVQLVAGQYVANTTSVGSQSSPHGLNGQANDFWNGQFGRQTGSNNIIDATALKIREISLGYSLPSKMLKDTGIDAFKFAINARNPFTFFFADGNHGKKNLGYTDPEASNAVNLIGASPNSTGISDVGQYPSLRTLGFSLNVTF